MKKFLVLIFIAAAAALFGHYKHWIDLGLSPLPREQLAAGAERPRFPGFGGRGTKGPQRRVLIPVLGALVKRQDVPVSVDAVGTIQAMNMVTVRAQVEGRLLEVLFTEGQDVKAGEVLARIDPRTYQAQYDQAVAKKAQGEAQLANARIDLERYERLAKTNFGTRQQADTQRAVVSQLEAQTKIDQALIDAARTTLDYTTIRAPISGRTGFRSVDAGNVVRAGDAAGLVTIAQIQPVAMTFNLPQQHLQALRDAQARGPALVQVLAPDNATVIGSGRVEVIDNLVDPTTGTVRVKAQYDNADLRLWPGQFVNVRVFIGMVTDATIVPSIAVQRGPDGPYVYVISKDGKAVQTSVTISMQTEQLAVIEKGVVAGQSIVVSGFGRLSDEAEVTVTMQKDPDKSATDAGPTDKAAPQAKEDAAKGGKPRG